MVLEQVGAGEKGGQATLFVDDRELALLRVTEDAVGLEKGDALGRGDELRGHDLGKRSRRVTELHVAVRNDTDELAAERAGLCKRRSDNVRNISAT